MRYYIARQKDESTNSWLLQDIDSGATTVVTTDEIKKHLGIRDVKVLNLTVAKDGSLRREPPFKFNTASLDGLQKAPQMLKSCGLDIASVEQQEYFEHSLDLLMSDCVKYIDSLPNMEAKLLDKDKNLLQIKTRVKDNLIGADEFVTYLIRYEKVVYGTAKPLKDQTKPCICGDIMLGVRALRLPSGQAVNFDTGETLLSSHVQFPYMDKKTFRFSDELWVRDIGGQRSFVVDTTIKSRDGHLFALDGEREVRQFAELFCLTVGDLVLKVCNSHGAGYDAIKRELANALSMIGRNSESRMSPKTKSEFARIRKAVSDKLFDMKLDIKYGVKDFVEDHEVGLGLTLAGVIVAALAGVFVWVGSMSLAKMGGDMTALVKTSASILFGEVLVGSTIHGMETDPQGTLLSLLLLNVALDD